MDPSAQNTIYTIGHSTHDIATLVAMLESFGIRTLVDIRHYPGSRRFPHFNKEQLCESLSKAGIDYLHLEGLGGRRSVQKNSKNDRWRNSAFRGYADYMETDEFKNAIEALESIALKRPTAYMCAEAVWWRCHRALVSDYLKAKGWKVQHITAVDKAAEHPYTSAARVVGGRVYYSEETNMFGQMTEIED
ncbi:MAG TPA: DUF488 domain-containing protein [Cyclobacteriaceae bacterium]|jgi:uncharacterized protein (DUF488 family)